MRLSRSSWVALLVSAGLLGAVGCNAFDERVEDPFGPIIGLGGGAVTATGSVRPTGVAGTPVTTGGQGPTGSPSGGLPSVLMPAAGATSSPTAGSGGSPETGGAPTTQPDASTPDEPVPDASTTPLDDAGTIPSVSDAG